MRTRPALGLFLFALGSGCGGSSAPSAAPTTPAVAGGGGGAPVSMAGPKKMLSLGDSYTIGTGVQATERWPAQLIAQLRDKGVMLGAPIYIAQNGWTTDELSAAMDKEDFYPPYDFITLQIGVNNQFRGRSADEFRTQFTALLKRAVTLAGNRAERVLVLSIPDYSVTPYAKEKRKDLAADAKGIDAFNAIKKEETQKAGARYVDVTGLSRKAKDDGSLLAGDALHPSAAMYKLWAAAALPDAEAVFARGKAKKQE